VAFYPYTEFEKPGGLAMTHSQTHAGIAIGATVLISALIAFLPPIPPLRRKARRSAFAARRG